MRGRRDDIVLMLLWEVAIRGSLSVEEETTRNFALFEDELNLEPSLSPGVTTSEARR